MYACMTNKHFNNMEHIHSILIQAFITAKEVKSRVDLYHCIVLCTLFRVIIPIVVGHYQQSTWSQPCSSILIYPLHVHGICKLK